tara:strand:+ start:21338 stop:21598 length:261 start_codon:yes stop_codon:yes gene_type:complete
MSDLDKIEVKVVADGYRDIIQTSSRKIAARVIALILEEEEANPLTPEQSAIKALTDELENLRGEVATANYNKDQAVKKLAALENGD